MHIDILSLFPGYFRGPFDESIIKRARQAGILSINLIDIRSYSKDSHRRVDDRPYGGGPGMVMAPQPVVDAVRDVRQQKSKVIYMSPQGAPLTAKKCRELAQEEHLMILCGHYEGIDQRALDLVVDEEISIGDYVLTNGCLSAIVLVDALARFVPGVLGEPAAADEDSFEGGRLDCPHYTRPEVFEEIAVPEVLLSGDHRLIEKWRLTQSLDKMKKKRSDLYSMYAGACVARDEGGKEAKMRSIGSRTVLAVKDLAAAKRFYGKGLGIKSFQAPEGILGFSLSDCELRLIQDEDVEKSDIQRDGWHELHVESSSELQKLLSRMARLGIICRCVRADGQLKEVHVEDPDGHRWVIKLI